VKCCGLRSAQLRAPATARPLEAEVCLLQPYNGDLLGAWMAVVLAIWATLMDSGFAVFRHADEGTSEPHGGFVRDAAKRLGEAECIYTNPEWGGEGAGTSGHDRFRSGLEVSLWAPVLRPCVLFAFG
jgi:hypothetical protein